jgi:hypothetical protein
LDPETLSYFYATPVQNLLKTYTEAVHNIAHFRQDIEFMKRTFDFLSNTLGLSYIGNYHSHHILGINGLSPGDIASTHSIALKNSYHRMCQFVLTFEKIAADKTKIHESRFRMLKRGGHLTFKRASRQRCLTFEAQYDEVPDYPHNMQKYGVRMHSFFYCDAMKGQPTRCSLKILPGKSPFRLALEQNREIDIGMKYSQSVDTTIEYDVYKPIIEPKINLPEKIYSQLTKLSENISAESNIKFDDEFILISTPLTMSENVVTVIFKNVAPFQVVGVFLAQENQKSDPVDLTSELLSNDYNCDLLEIYKGAQKIFENTSEIIGDNNEDTKSICLQKQNNLQDEIIHKDNGDTTCQDSEMAPRREVRDVSG